MYDLLVPTEGVVYTPMPWTLALTTYCNSYRVPLVLALEKSAIRVAVEFVVVSTKRQQLL